MSTPVVFQVMRPATVPADVFFPSIILQPRTVLETLTLATLSPHQAAYILPKGFRAPTHAETLLYLQKALDLIHANIMKGKNIVLGDTIYIVPLNPGETKPPADGSTTTQPPPSTGIASLDALINFLNTILEPLTTIAKTVSTAGTEFTARLKNTAENVGSLVAWVDQPRTWLRILLISGGLIVTIVGVYAFTLSFGSVQDIERGTSKVIKIIAPAAETTAAAA